MPPIIPFILPALKLAAGGALLGGGISAATGGSFGRGAGTGALAGLGGGLGGILGPVGAGLGAAAGTLGGQAAVSDPLNPVTAGIAGLGAGLSFKPPVKAPVTVPGGGGFSSAGVNLGQTPARFGGEDFLLGRGINDIQTSLGNLSEIAAQPAGAGFGGGGLNLANIPALNARTASLAAPGASASIPNILGEFTGIQKQFFPGAASSQVAGGDGGGIENLLGNILGSGADTGGGQVANGGFFDIGNILKGKNIGDFLPALLSAGSLLGTPAPQIPSFGGAVSNLQTTLQPLQDLQLERFKQQLTPIAARGGFLESTRFDNLLKEFMESQNAQLLSQAAPFAGQQFGAQIGQFQGQEAQRNQLLSGLGQNIAGIFSDRSFEEELLKRLLG